jgi:GNAT superfamily N-acetyltransferase
VVKKKAVKIRSWQLEDVPAIVECHKAAYADYPPGGHYEARFYEMQVAAFPEGQLLAELEGRVVGYATTLIVQLDDEGHSYTYEEITGGGTFNTHTPSGDTLYGADIAVHPDFRGRGVAAALYRARKQLLKRYNLRRMVAYGRIPGYSDVAGRMTPEEYVRRVKLDQSARKAKAVN